jgi:hypothetical protein
VGWTTNGTDALCSVNLEIAMSIACEWQSIETAPQDGTAVLLFHPSWEMVQVGVHYDDTSSWQNPCGDLLEPPTHWMTLPPPPEGSGQNGHAGQ